MDNLIENFNKTGNQNIFEEVIDLMMVDELGEKHGIDNEFKNKLKNLPTEQKRIIILGMLEKTSSRPLFMKIKALTDKNINRMEHIKDVILMLREYVKVGEVEKKKFGEVMTPLDLVKEMLQTLPEEVWSNPNLKWLDPANGTGPFPAMVIYKLMEGLKEWEPDDNKRYKHIIENMIYVSELQPKNMFLWLCVADPFDEYLTNIYTGSFLDEGFDNHMKDVWGVEKFDIVIGNPPYQEPILDNKRSRPLYDQFTMKSLPLTNKLLFVFPSRWLTGGFGLNKFRKQMFKSKNIKIIKHFDDATKIFGKSVDIVGGVSYYLFDNKYNGFPKYNGIEINLSEFDIFVENKYRNILRKILSNSNRFLSEICNSQSYFGFPGNNSLFSKIVKKDYIKVYVSKQKGFENYVSLNDIKDKNKINGFKVFTTAANGEKPCFGNKILGYPNEVASKSYMVLLINSEEEGKSLISYMNTKFCNFFLSLRKKTQNMKPDTLKWIPLVPFDREWADEQLFEYFNLSEDERELINERDN